MTRLKNKQKARLSCFVKEDVVKSVRSEMSRNEPHAYIGQTFLQQQQSCSGLRRQKPSRRWKFISASLGLIQAVRPEETGSISVVSSTAYFRGNLEEICFFIYKRPWCQDAETFANLSLCLVCDNPFFVLSVITHFSTAGPHRI